MRDPSGVPPRPCRRFCGRVRLPWLILAALPIAAGCAPALMRLPSGVGRPAPDGAALFARATAACRGVHVLTAEIAATGTIAGGRVRGHLLAGLGAPDSLRLEGVAPFGQPLFVLVAQHGEGTLLLPRDHRVLQHASPEALVDALAGVALSPAGLLAILSGCGSVEASPLTVRAYGGDWLRVDEPGGATVYLRRAGGSWQVAVALMPQPGGGRLRVEYSDRRAGRPQAVRLVEGAADTDLRLRLSQVDINTPLAANAFRVAVPAGAVPITLEELRQSGLLGGASRP